MRCYVTLISKFSLRLCYVTLSHQCEAALTVILIFILQWTYRDSVLSSDTRLHVNPIHFLARRAVC